MAEAYYNMVVVNLSGTPWYGMLKQNGAVFQWFKFRLVFGTLCPRAFHALFRF